MSKIITLQANKQIITILNISKKESSWQQQLFFIIIYTSNIALSGEIISTWIVWIKIDYKAEIAIIIIQY